MNPWLLAFLAALAVVALAAFALRRSARPSARGGASRLSPREDDLGQLGISEVRPRSSAERAPEVARPPAPQGPARPGPGGARKPGAPGSAAARGAGPKGAAAPKPEPARERKPPAPRPAPAEPEDAALDEVFGAAPPAASASAPAGAGDILGGVRARAAREGENAGAPGVTDLLDSLRAALAARGVVLLRYEAAADTYTVVGRAGAGFGGAPAFPAAGNALHRVPADRSISLLEPEAFVALRYHLRPESTVGHAAAIAVGADARHLLVADRGTDDGPFAAAQLDLLGDYADLMGRLLGAAPRPPAPPAAAEPEADADLDALLAARAGEPEAGDAEEAAEGEPGADAAEEAPALPQRRTIIAEEMAAARAAGRPLALALVVPRGADTLDGHSAEDLAAAEDALMARLAATEGSARVERFGDLLAGVFGAFDAAGAEAWADRAEAREGPLLHIGVALLAEHHEDPDDLRADAAAALQEAYERGTACVILE